MTEFGGLLDPIGFIWGMSAALVLLAWAPNPVANSARKELTALSLFGFCIALVVTILASVRGVLYWSVLPSALMHTAFFVVLGLAGFWIGRRLLPANLDRRSGHPRDRER